MRRPGLTTNLKMRAQTRPASRRQVMNPYLSSTWPRHTRTCAGRPLLRGAPSWPAAPAVAARAASIGSEGVAHGHDARRAGASRRTEFPCLTTMFFAESPADIARAKGAVPRLPGDRRLPGRCARAGRAVGRLGRRAGDAGRGRREQSGGAAGGAGPQAVILSAPQPAPRTPGATHAQPHRAPPDRRPAGRGAPPRAEAAQPSSTGPLTATFALLGHPAADLWRVPAIRTGGGRRGTSRPRPDRLAGHPVR